MIDHCRAIEAVLSEGEVGETYNVGSGVERSIEEIADGVLAALGKPADAQDDRPRPARPRPPLPARLVQDRRRAGLGARQVPFEQGLADTVAWYAGEPGLVGAARATGRRSRRPAWDDGAARTDGAAECGSWSPARAASSAGSWSTLSSAADHDVLACDHAAARRDRPRRRCCR